MPVSPLLKYSFEPLSYRLLSMGREMRRREFITLLGGAAVVLPFATRAQRRSPMRRVGVLMNVAEADPESAARIAAFLQGLQQSGWSGGRDVRIDTRWAAGDVERFRRYAAELVALTPDVILASSSLAVAALQQATHTTPIVFVGITDPVGAGFVDSLARPGGNATGFTLFEYGLSGKWLELVKEIAPATTRAAVLRDPASPAESGMFTAIQSVAPSVGVELNPFEMRDSGEIEGAITAFAGRPNGGLIVLGSSLANVHRELIITLAARHRLPAVYSDRIFVASGGLISYGPNRIEQFRRGAAYVDRILRGEKPSDLPVQAPTKYELVINLKTAKALDLTVPQTLLARADEVIE
jgi:putative ABC transport system substrate-binding protein